jgi:hypothetical protein
MAGMRNRDPDVAGSSYLFSLVVVIGRVVQQSGEGDGRFRAELRRRYVERLRRAESRANEDFSMSCVLRMCKAIGKGPLRGARSQRAKSKEILCIRRKRTSPDHVRKISLPHTRSAR